MRNFIIASLAALGLAACNNPFTGQPVTSAQIASDVTTFCSAEGALAVVIAQDGTVLKASAGQTAAIAQGTQLVALNCAALVAILGTAPTTASPTALAAWEETAASKLHISSETLHRIIKRYTR